MKKLFLTTILTASIATAAHAADNAKHNDHEGRIGFEKAKEIAVEAVKNSIKVVEAELEIDDDNEASYEVEVEAGGVTTEIEIDAKTGEVLEMEADD
jgi:uncharacterized membrane protein YkoI